MTRNTLIFFILIFSLPSLAQDNNEAVESVRNEFYRITGNDIELNQIKYNDISVYLERNRVAFIKQSIENGTFEFYYKKSSDNKYSIYFIYFNSNNKVEAPDLRLYYDDYESLVLFKKNQDQVELSSIKRIDGQYLLMAMNNLNTFLQISYEARFDGDTRASQIDMKIPDLKSKISTTDTVSYNIDDGGESGELLYKDRNGSILQTVKFSYGQHGGSEKSEYFINGNLAYSTVENHNWYGVSLRFRTDIKYFERGQMFKSLDYDNMFRPESNNTDKSNGLRFSLNGIVPLITYY